MNEPRLADWLAHRAATMPDRLALVAHEREWSYRALHAEACDAARRLATLGVGRGDRVATLLGNGAAPAIVAHAVRRLGAVLVPLNTRLTAEEIAWQAADAAPRLLLAHARTAPLADAARASLGTLAVTMLDADDRLRAASDAGVALVEDAAPDDIMAILYTSGTTGTPKGAMLTVGNFWWSAIGSAMNIGQRDDDRWLACLPLFHVGGLSIVIRAAIYGCAAIVHEGFDAHAVNRAIDEQGITLVSVVATMLQRMLDARGNAPYPPTLRCVLLGGGPASAGLLARCAELGVPVVQTYGLTETASQLATLAPQDALRKPGSSGKALYPNALRIAVADGASDGAGEILVRGPVVMAGYLDRPEATERAIVNGWLHTGDIGRLDDEGYLYVLDRRDDLIITGGENVYPAEVEAVLLTHPDVAEAAVVGVADPEWGRKVVGVVRLVAGAAGAGIGERLVQHCRRALAGYKVPREIRVASAALPRTASGKLRRSMLRDWLADA